MNFIMVEMRLAAVEYLLPGGIFNGNVGREATTDATKAHRDFQKFFIDVN